MLSIRDHLFRRRQKHRHMCMSKCALFQCLPGVLPLALSPQSVILRSGIAHESWTDGPFYVMGICIVTQNLNNLLHSFGDR